MTQQQPIPTYPVGQTQLPHEAPPQQYQKPPPPPPPQGQQGGYPAPLFEERVVIKSKRDGTPWERWVIRVAPLRSPVQGGPQNIAILLVERADYKTGEWKVVQKKKWDSQTKRYVTDAQNKVIMEDIITWLNKDIVNALLGTLSRANQHL